MVGGRRLALLNTRIWVPLIGPHHRAEIGELTVTRDTLNEVIERFRCGRDEFGASVGVGVVPPQPHQRISQVVFVNWHEDHDDASALALSALFLPYAGGSATGVIGAAGHRFYAWPPLLQ